MDATTEGIIKKYEFEFAFMVKFINGDQTNSVVDFERRYNSIESVIDFVMNANLISVDQWSSDKDRLFDETYEKRCRLSGFYNHKKEGTSDGTDRG